MKTHSIGTQGTVSAAAFVAAFFMLAIALQAEDLNAVYQQVRAAYYRGDYATALPLLTRVAAANPKHTDTANMLAYIRANYRPEPSSLKNQYAALIIPKVELGDVTLTEAVDGVRMLAKNASNGKVVPNVIIKGANVGERKLSLSLSNVPLSEVLNYVTQLTSTGLSYEQHAVILTSTADVSSIETDTAPKASK